jgi:hypothetical protein
MYCMAQCPTPNHTETFLTILLWSYFSLLGSQETGLSRPGMVGPHLYLYYSMHISQPSDIPGTQRDIIK